MCSLSSGACGELEAQPQEGKKEAVTVLSPAARQVLDTDLTAPGAAAEAVSMGHYLGSA